MIEVDGRVSAEMRRCSVRDWLYISGHSNSDM